MSLGVECDTEDTICKCTESQLRMDVTCLTCYVGKYQHVLTATVKCLRTTEKQD